MKLSIRIKVLLSVGLTIVFVLGISTAVYFQDLKHAHLQAIELRSDALAQGLLNNLYKMGTYTIFTPENIPTLWGSLTTQCEQIYALNKDKHVTHIALLSSQGDILVHNRKELRQTQIGSETILKHLGTYRTITIRDPEDNIFHTLIPIFDRGDEYLGAIDIGFPGQILDQQLHAAIQQAFIMLFGFSLIACTLIMVFFTFTVTRPLRYLVQIGERLSQGHLIHQLEIARGHDEIANLANVFVQISDYLGEIGGIAGQVATGSLSHDIRKRSKRDALGTALQDMLAYLQRVAEIASQIAEGDLTVAPPLRSDSDAFGRAMRSMTEGLQSLIHQIRTSAEQISATGSDIAALSDSDIQIVQTAQTSVENMVATMTQMGTSVEDVAQNMDLLSASVEETSASMAVMTTSITNIASSTNDLAEQTQTAIAELHSSNVLLDAITGKTEVSRQLSQDTIHDALEGQQTVEDVTSSMDTIQQTNSSAVETITSFAKQTQDIGTILDVIDEITDQSSLLALNASIIAAQAGTHGRGFAVIADEMRNLANKVSESTKDIAAIIRIVQQETETVVQKIHKGTTDIAQGVTRTQQARTVLQNIFDSAQRSSDVVSDIADAVQQLQQTTSQEMRLVMERVNSMTVEITRATNEQKSSTIQINQAIEHISNMAFQTQHETTEQLKGVREVLDATEQVKTLTAQNLNSSEQIDHTAAELAYQAQLLLQSVDRFKLEINERLAAEEVSPSALVKAGDDQDTALPPVAVETA